MTTDLQPFFDQVQAHYDVSDDFFALFLDPSMTYSCAYFEREDMSLEEAQMAKIDLSLGKLDLQPGMKLLDIGCGWGATLKRAIEKYDVTGVGLTLSRNQHRTAAARLEGLPAEVRLQGWEEFHDPVDRIVSIGAFEHFRIKRYPAFFQRCHDVLPEDGGRMLLHTIVMPSARTLAEQGVDVNHDDVLFAKFINRCIFPGGQLAAPERITEEATKAGFTCARTQALGPHYARTLDHWAAALEQHKDRAIAAASQHIYDMYRTYLTGCADYFRSGHIDIMQFTLVK